MFDISLIIVSRFYETIMRLWDCCVIMVNLYHNMVAIGTQRLIYERWDFMLYAKLRNKNL